MVDQIVNLGYALMLVAQAIRNILVLRVILILAQGAFITYGMITSNVSMIIWNTVFILINVYQSVILIKQRSPVVIPEDIVDIYEKVFSEMSKREFIYFWQIGKKVDFNGEIIIREGEHQDNLYLIIEGEATVISNKKEIATLRRGDFLAEMSLLSGEPASADVMCRDEVTCITWSRENLDNLKKLNYKLWSKLQHILSKDLISKVKRTSSKL